MKHNLPNCPVEITMSLINSKWTIFIIRDLLTSTMRFGEIKKSLNGISQKVLTSHLRNMEESGLIRRKVYPQVPPKVEYSLTELGLSLKTVINSMHKWGEEYKEKINQNT